LPRLAVPAHRQIAGLIRLDAVDRVQDHHPLGDLGDVLAESAAFGVAAPDGERGVSLHLLDDLLQLRGNLRDRPALDAHLSARTLLRHHVHPGERRIGRGKIVAEVRAPALLPLQRRAGHRLGDGDQVAQVEGGVPAGVVGAIAVDAHARGAIAQLCQVLHGLRHLALAAHDATMSCIISCRSCCTR